MPTNQTIMTGPNSAPTRPVPRRWTENRPIRIATVIGITSGRSAGVDHLETLDRGEHRDRGREHAVAVEQRRAEQPEQRQPGGVARRVARHRERHQRQDAALAAVVRAQHEARYLTEITSTSDQSTSDRMPSTFAGRDRHPVLAVEALAQRVERARADVAVDDAERTEREHEQAPAARRVVGTLAVVRRGGFAHQAPSESTSAAGPRYWWMTRCRP